MDAFELSKVDKEAIAVKQRANIEFHFDVMLRTYRNRAIEYYSEELESSKEAFLFMEPVKILLVFREMICDIYYFRSETDEVLIETWFQETYEEYAKLKDMPEKKLYTMLEEKYQITDYLYHEVNEYALNWPRPDTELGYEYDAEKDGKAFCDQHASNIELGRKLDELMKSDTSSIENFDLEELINLVDDAHFTYEFKESLAAYNYGLYFASMTAAVVSFETLLRVAVIKLAGLKSLPKDNMYILGYARVLIKHDFLDGRDEPRIKSANDLRTAATHSKTGKMDVEDVEQIYRMISRMASKLFAT